nr:MAG TPA: hypothetical protein [Caudoviricetes sp.]
MSCPGKRKKCPRKRSPIPPELATRHNLQT